MSLRAKPSVTCPRNPTLIGSSLSSNYAIELSASTEMLSFTLRRETTKAWPIAARRMRSNPSIQSGRSASHRALQTPRLRPAADFERWAATTGADAYVEQEYFAIDWLSECDVAAWVRRHVRGARSAATDDCGQLNCRSL